MTKVKIIILILSCANFVFASCSGTTIGSYTYCGGSFTDGAGTSVSVTYSPTAGNGIILLAKWLDQTANANSIQNQSSSNLTCFVASPNTPFNLTVDSGNDTERWIIYYCPSINSGVTAIKVNFSKSLAYGEVVILEMDSASILSSDFWGDETDDGGEVSAGRTGTISFTNTFSNSLIVSWMHNGQASGPPVGGWPPVTGTAGYTALVTSPTLPPNGIVMMKAVTSSALQSTTITWDTNDLFWFGSILNLKSSETLATPTAHAVISGPAVIGGNAVIQ